MIPKNKILIQLLLVLSFLWSSCDKDKEAKILNPTTINTGTEATNNESIRLDKVLSTETTITNLNIVVTDENKTIISNAEITINNETYTTNDNGFVVVENIQLNKEFQIITTQFSGYTTSIKTITPSNNGVTNVSITLVQPTFEETFNATKGGTVSNENLSIEFPSDAIADQDGNLYEGEVTTTVTYYDPTSTSFSETIPGTLVGLDGNDTMQALISKGMIKVDLTDTSGNELEIFEGKEATITLPANTNDPEIIDFWHLNEEKGIWVQTGTATKVGNTYVATVTHFSTYNLDAKVESIDITFIIKDTNGNLMTNQPATITATHSSGIYSRFIITDNLGEFTIINAPKGADFNLDFSTACEANTNIVVGTINENTTKELIIEPLSEGTLATTIEGTLKGCSDNDIYTNTSFVIKITNGDTIDEIQVTTDNDGKYSISSVLCNYNPLTIYPAEILVFDINNNDQLIIKKTNLIFDNNYNLLTDINVCDGVITKIGVFDDYFKLNQTDNIVNFEVFDEDAIDIYHFIIYNTNENVVGYYYGTTRAMDFSYLFTSNYTLRVLTNKGIFSTELNITED